MLHNFQLAAIVKQSAQVRLQRVPMHQSLQDLLATEWSTQLKAFLDAAQEIVYDAGYQPEEHECFALCDFELPEWLVRESSSTISNLDSLDQNEALNDSIKAIAGFARDEVGNEMILFQNFSRSHVIRPGTFLLLQHGTYERIERPGLTLNSKLAAVYRAAEQKLLFRTYRTVNTFLPLGDYYEEASEQQIREVLAHVKLAPVNAEAIATESNQWFRKRFAMLRESDVLEKYTAKQIQNRAKGYDVEIHVENERIIFPEEKPAAKKLLQFLNEELFKGAITETLYETNSKREAD